MHACIASHLHLHLHCRPSNFLGGSGWVRDLGWYALMLLRQLGWYVG